MKTLSKSLLLAVCLGAGIFFTVTPPVCAQPNFRETEAYRQFVKKPQNDFAKIIFLMNYYRTAPFTIVFDGADYTPEFAFPFAQVYLFTHYKQEKAVPWIKKHCYRSVIGQNVIYLRFPSGKYEPARDVILRDLAELNRVLEEDQKDLKTA